MRNFICLVAAFCITAGWISAAQTHNVSTAQQEVIDASKARMDAAAKRDLATWLRFVATDCLFSDDNGALVTKAQMLEHYKKLPAEYDRTLDPRDHVVHLYGHTAVVNYRATTHEQVGNTDILSEQRRTETFVKKNGSWLLIAIQWDNIPVNFRKPVAVDPKIYNDYCGEYLDRPGSDVEAFFVKDGKLWSRVQDQVDENLPLGGDTVFIRDGDLGTITFSRDAQGHVIGYIYNRVDGQHACQEDKVACPERQLTPQQAYRARNPGNSCIGWYPAVRAAIIRVFQVPGRNSSAGKSKKPRCCMHVRALTVIASLSLLIFFMMTLARSHPSTHGLLVVANQFEHSALLVDPETRREVAKIVVGVNGHEVAVSKDGRFAYVPIYGNSGVGKPGTDGSSIDVIDLRERKLAYTIDLGKPLRPHEPAIGPDGRLYVTTELSQSLDAIDPATRKIIVENPTGQPESHMFVITPDGGRAYTANVHSGTVSVLDLVRHSLVTTIPVSKMVQRITIQPDGLFVFTHDQESPRIAVIDTATNTVASWIDLPESAYSSEPTPDGRWLVAAGLKGHIFVIDLHTRKLAKTFGAPTALGKVLVRPDGNVAYISFLTAGKIEVLDLRSWQMQPSIDLTPGVDGMAWASN
jgi:YVTN family beta-propeller protein